MGCWWVKGMNNLVAAVPLGQPVNPAFQKPLDRSQIPIQDLDIVNLSTRRVVAVRAANTESSRLRGWHGPTIFRMPNK